MWYGSDAGYFHEGKPDNDFQLPVLTDDLRFVRGNRELDGSGPGLELLGSHLVCGELDGCHLLRWTVSGQTRGVTYDSSDAGAGVGGRWRCFAVAMRRRM